VAVALPPADPEPSDPAAVGARTPARAVCVAALLVASLVGCANDTSGVASVTAGASARSAAADVRSPGAAASTLIVPKRIREFRSTRRLAAVAAPSRIRIPAIGVDSSLERLTRQRDGTIGVPVDWDRAGWFSEGPRPGHAGAAVILGHVDSPSGPAVFSRLRELRRGNAIHVQRRDGSRVAFVVDRIEQHQRRRFPVREVYWPTLTRELRLVTCGGTYDRSAGGYQSNIILFATQRGAVQRR
jgi:hypothetical protein